nr:hypothetical protein [Gemmatimonadales bacterium]
MGFLQCMRLTAILAALLAGVNAAGSAYGSDGRPNGGSKPVWSPDGTKVAFLSGTPNRPLNLWIAEAEGDSAPRQLTRLGARLTGWAADGKTLYCETMRGGSSSLYKVDVAAGVQTPALSFLPQGATDIAWSPEGSHVAYVVPHQEHRDLWVAGTDGTGHRQLTESLHVRSMDWSPAGDAIAFDVGGVAGRSTYTVDASGESEPTKVFGGIGSDPSWSPDASLLALVGMHSLTVVKTDGGGAKRLHVSQADRTPLDWSADGRRLAFTAVQGRTLGISTVDVETEEQVTIAAPWDLAGYARWSPDGRL